MMERPKGTALAARKSSSNRGNRRRNSSAMAARLRMTERALGWVMVGSVRILEQNTNKAKVPERPAQVFGLPAAFRLEPKAKSRRRSDAAGVLRRHRVRIN